MKTNERRIHDEWSGAQDGSSDIHSITATVIRGKYATAEQSRTITAAAALACYAGVPDDVVTECERIYTVSKAVRLEALGRIRDTLAPYGQFKQWCADHDENYATVSNALSGVESRRQVMGSITTGLLDAVDVEATDAKAPPFIALSRTTSIEYYTPAPYVEAARAVMGGIDLDPASCAEANATVQAARYYDIHTNGFDKPWTGRVWLNPPYGRDEDGSRQDKWTLRLLEQYAAGSTTQAVLLCNASVDTAWFHRLVDYLVCFPCGRIDFTTPAANRASSSTTSNATHGSALVYLGPHRNRFITVFRPFGVVMEQASLDAAPTGGDVR